MVIELEELAQNVIVRFYQLYTVKPPNNGANEFVPCREVVPISEVK